MITIFSNYTAISFKIDMLPEACRVCNIAFFFFFIFFDLKLLEHPLLGGLVAVLDVFYLNSVCHFK